MSKEKLTAKNLQEKVGYGFGTTIGYTDDGKVFVVNDTQDAEGRPMQTMMELTPDRAIQISQSLVKAAENARKHITVN